MTFGCIGVGGWGCVRLVSGPICPVVSFSTGLLSTSSITVHVVDRYDHGSCIAHQDGRGGRRAGAAPALVQEPVQPLAWASLLQALPLLGAQGEKEGKSGLCSWGCQVMRMTLTSVCSERLVVPSLSPRHRVGFLAYALTAICGIPLRLTSRPVVY